MRRHAPDVVAALGVIGFVSAIGLTFSNHSLPRATPDEALVTVMTFAFAFSGAIGWLILRRTGNVIGWIFLTFATAGVWWSSSGEYLIHSFGIGRLPGPTTVAVSGNVIAAVMTLPLALVCLVFPTGSLSSPRWRPVLWAWFVGGACLLVWSVIRPGELWSAPDRVPGRSVVGPFSPPAWIASGLLGIGVTLLLGAGFAGVISLVLRARRATGEERQQIRWLTFVAASVAVMLALLLGSTLVLAPFHIRANGTAEAIGNFVFAVIVFLIVLGMPAAVAIAVLKYKLYEIDVVVSKTIVIAGLAGFIAIVYAGVVAGVGRLIPATHDSVPLAIAATAIVAILFDPVRRRVRRFADRVVFGERATPYEVLARFSDRVGAAYATADVLPRTARVICEGVGAERVEIWLQLAGNLHCAATWPTSDTSHENVPVADGDDLPALDAERTVPVRLQGELLGAIAVTKARSEPLSPQDVNLVDHLADQAALVLANVRLTADLEARLEQIERQAAELRASRQRIVAAQDEERRRLERNIHDGAQQHLVALAVKLRLARQFAERDPGRAHVMLEELTVQIDEALDTLQSLALGVYPPLLEEQGLAAALAAQYARSDLPVRLETEGLARYPIELEAAVYFCTLEALQNAAKYSHAAAISIGLRERDGSLEFDVEDDGIGFVVSENGGGTGLHGMRDRLAVFGGDVTVRSAPGQGTHVHGRLPVPVMETSR